MSENPIVTHRKRLGLSRSELSLLIGVSPAHVGYWERGDRTPTESITHRLAALFGCPTTELAAEVEAYRATLRRRALEKAQASPAMTRGSE
jgi:transcriptional regulator with XRE-family HTH domain